MSGVDHLRYRSYVRFYPDPLTPRLIPDVRTNPDSRLIADIETRHISDLIPTSDIIPIFAAPTNYRHPTSSRPYTDVIPNFRH